MSKITIPLTEVITGGTLKNWYYDNCIIRSDVVKTTDTAYAYAEDTFDLGGEVEGYLMAVNATINIMSTNVASTLPNYQKLDDLGALIAKEFSDWLVPGAEIWKKDDNTRVIFYTNPFAGNQSEYLKGSEIKIINDISPANIDILTIAEAEAETASGWTKL
jgi:hypothetical protein